VTLSVAKALQRQFNMRTQHCGMTLTGRNRSTRKKKTCQCNFVHHKSHMDWPGIEPGPPRHESGD